MSYSGYKSSPRGSRGFSRGGGYRGSSRGGGGDSNWRAGGRGYSGSSRGSGRGSRGFSSSGSKWDRGASSGSYESRPRYVSGGGERYSSHSRDEGSYRYRGEDSISSYTSREHSHRSSSPDRKRMRIDYSPASSMHRSHDYGDDSYSSRNYSHSSYENKRMRGGYDGGEERRTSLFREERERIRSDDYEFRKPLSMGGSRYSVPRGSSYRSRSFSRGMRSSSGYNRRPMSYRGGTGGGVFIKRRLVDNYGVRKRIATGKSQEYLRRLKLYRLQRLKRLRDRADNEEEQSDEEVEEEEIEEEVEVTDEENEEPDVKEEEDDEKEKKEDNEDEEIEEKKEEEKKKKVVKKVVKMVKKIKRVPKERKESEKGKDENSEGKEIHVTVKQDSEGRDVETPVRKNYLGQPFIKLECPHCNTIADTFKVYLNHLYSSKHQTAMMNVAVKVRKSLAKLRIDQRTEQRDLDEECKDMNMRTFYCLICKLNYRSLKSEHLSSEKHLQMRNFLNPRCKVCRIFCKTPMMYENHICSLDHLKRKHYLDKKSAELQQEGNEINMDNFMVLDQVGSGEEDSESESSEKGEKETEDKSEEKTGEEEKKEEKKPKKPKKIVNLGSEYCKKIEVYFCDLCKNFLPRIEDQEQALAVHCRGQRHLHWYVKKKDQEALRKRAERIHRMREEQKKAEIKEEVKDEPIDEDALEAPKDEDLKKVVTEKVGEDIDGEANMDDKTWSEVNKDLGDLLRQVEEPGSDDEEDSRAAGRRYDRFKHSEKGKPGEEEKGKSEEKAVKVEAVNGEKDDA